LTIPQIILYAITALMILFIVRRSIQKARMKEYSPNQVAELQYNDSILLLDVRSKEERSRHHIQGSLHIPVNELTSKLNLLEKHREKEIICYCHSGSRSFVAAAMLQKHGFIASNMKGGISAWHYHNL